MIECGRICLVLRFFCLQFLIICCTIMQKKTGGRQGLVMRPWNRLLEMKTRIMLSLISHLHFPLESMLYSQIFIWPWNEDEMNECLDAGTAMSEAASSLCCDVHFCPTFSCRGAVLSLGWVLRWQSTSSQMSGDTTMIVYASTVRYVLTLLVLATTQRGDEKAKKVLFWYHKVHCHSHYMWIIKGAYKKRGTPMIWCLTDLFS